MSSQNIIQLIAFVCFMALILVVARSGRFRGKSPFLVCLVAAAGWSFTSFMCTSPEISDGQKLIWTKMVLPFASWAIVAYSVFVTSYTSKRNGLISIAGYGYVLLIIALAATGMLYQNYGAGTGTLPQDFGYWLLLIAGGNSVFILISSILLVRDYRLSTDPDHRNRVLYIITGLAIFIAAELTWSLEFSLYSIDQVGHILNALLITYAVMKYQVLDIKLALRKSLVFTGTTTFITAGCIILIAIWTYLWKEWSSSMGIVTTLGVVVIMSMLFNPLRNLLEKETSVLFYGKSFDYRQTILNFSSKISNIIDLEQLAEAILSPLTNALRAGQASLLFAKEGRYVSKYAKCYKEGDPLTQVTLRKDGPLIKLLEHEEKPLTQDIICHEAKFLEMREEERNALKAAEIEVLCPVKSKHKLIAVVALSKKYQRGRYSRDDMDLLMTLASQAGVAIENAELYEKAKQRANTDELTGLFNHRCFHQRLEEEIARSARFGEIFSLILFDVDHFKNYNDLSGHLNGDEVLRCIGGYMKKSVRDSDICFRYGGDEFAIILPETSPEGGQMVAERIRKMIEEKDDQPGIPVTISIGVASWPTDGVMKDELIRSADAGLYYSKQTGRNRTSLACEVALSQVFQVESAANRKNADSEALLSTIYTLAATVDAKDHNTYGHSKKVSRYAMEMAKAMGFDEEEMKRIKAAALLHDIGKIGIPDMILQKSGILSVDERQKVQAHPNLGVAIIQHVDILRGCLAGIQYHHEQYNGEGYPSGLKGSNIPVDARILAVADAFDAMTSPRQYRKMLSYEEAIEELKKCAGIQFDPEIVEIFIGLRSKLFSPAKLLQGDHLQQEIRNPLS
jgi:diguanylate cyclase (GGDEF)-like protein/putative nucleotidyltransferase with HDIG domain